MSKSSTGHAIANVLALLVLCLVALAACTPLPGMDWLPEMSQGALSATWAGAGIQPYLRGWYLAVFLGLVGVLGKKADRQRHRRRLRPIAIALALAFSGLALVFIIAARSQAPEGTAALNFGLLAASQLGGCLMLIALAYWLGNTLGVDGVVLLVALILATKGARFGPNPIALGLTTLGLLLPFASLLRREHPVPLQRGELRAEARVPEALGGILPIGAALAFSSQALIIPTALGIRPLSVGIQLLLRAGLIVLLTPFFAAFFASLTGETSLVHLAAAALEPAPDESKLARLQRAQARFQRYALVSGTVFALCILICLGLEVVLEVRVHAALWLAPTILATSLDWLQGLALRRAEGPTTVAAEAVSLVEARLIQDALLAAQIPCIIRGEHAWALFVALSPQASLGLMVPCSRLKEAHRLLDELRPGAILELQAPLSGAVPSSP